MSGSIARRRRVLVVATVLGAAVLGGGVAQASYYGYSGEYDAWSGQSCGLAYTYGSHEEAAIYFADSCGDNDQGEYVLWERSSKATGRTEVYTVGDTADSASSSSAMVTIQACDDIYLGGDTCGAVTGVG